MRYRDNIEWLKSLKQQIGQTQHRDLWHFEQVIDETIENLKPLAKPHGRLIDANEIKEYAEWHCQRFIEGDHAEVGLTVDQINSFVRNAPTIIEAEE